MPRSGSVRVLSGFTRRRREGSAESGKTTHRTPAGRDPTGVPLAASLTNSSPLSGPPTDALASPAARPIRSSGSPAAPGGGCGAPRGRGQAAASSVRLASARFCQRRIELFDREIDIGLRVRRRNEACLEGGRREKHAASEGGLVPAREQRGVRSLRVSVAANYRMNVIRALHRALLRLGR